MYGRGCMSVLVKTYAQGNFTPLLAAAAVGAFNPQAPKPQTPPHRRHTPPLIQRFIFTRVPCLVMPVSLRVQSLPKEAVSV